MKMPLLQAEKLQQRCINQTVDTDSRGRNTLVAQYKYNCAKGDRREGTAFAVADLPRNNVTDLHRYSI